MWGHGVTIHHSQVHVSSDSPLSLPLQPHSQISHDKRHSLAWRDPSFSFLSPLLCLSLLPSSNPIPMPSSPSSSHTQPELWVHSPLIHRQSYLSSGTIATEQEQLRTAACRKIAPLSQGCGTLCIQQRQPSSLSLLHIKSCLLHLEKGFQFLCVWLLSKWNFYHCSAFAGYSKWLIAYVTGVVLSVCWSTARLFVCSLQSCVS